MNDLSIDQIEGDKTYNFITKYDEDNEIISQNMHSCKYYEMEDLKKYFSKKSSKFSTYCHTRLHLGFSAKLRI